MRLFVTVGTTKFEELVETVSQEEVLNKLHTLGYTSIQFQTGTGKFKEKSHPYIKLEYSSYFNDFQDEIKKSNLVISHAGAGTCIDVLRCEKPLIVVINENLMDNHQLELAKQLQKNEHVYYCTCEKLLETLKLDLNKLKKFPPQDTNAFGKYVDQCMGFA